MIYKILYPLIVSGLFLFAASALQAQTSELDAQLSKVDEEIAAKSFAEARKRIDEVIKQSPDSSRAHQKLAALHIIQQQYSESIPVFQKAIGLDAKNGGAFLGLGFAYLHSARYGPARAALLEAQALLPQKTADIQKIISWIDDKRLPENTSVGHSATSMPESVKAAVGHSDK